jgi:hypothetical protein
MNNRPPGFKHCLNVFGEMPDIPPVSFSQNLGLNESTVSSVPINAV